MTEKPPRHFQKTDPHLQSHAGFQRFCTQIRCSNAPQSMTHGLEFSRLVPTIADGILQRLWRWAFDHAPDGDITDLAMDDLRELTGWADEGEDLLVMLISCGFVERREDGTTLIAKWKDWGGAYFAPEAAEARQKWRDEFSKRQSDRAQRRWHPELFDDECNATSCGSDAGGMPEELEEELEVKNLMSDSSESDGFDSFWKSYPRREAKAGAHSLWLKMSNADRLAALAAVKHYATWCKANRDSLVMMPTTFLSKTGRRWEEWLNGPPAGRNNGAARPAPVEKPRCQCGATLTVDEEGVHCPMCNWREP